MKKGSGRFIFYTKQVKELLNKAQEQKDPAMWLLNNNARTPFFMLEALAKLYGNLHNAKKFEKLKVQFKLIEDGIGQVDYYNWLSIAFADKKEIPSDYKEYIKKELDQKAADLNTLLQDKDWLSTKNKRIAKINKKLKEIDWLDSKKEVEAISNFYKKSIKTITKFVTETNFCFDNIEDDVHELRRKLRWLSIYPQALQGVIQYGGETKAPPHLKKYLTPEIVNSPFNLMPPIGDNAALLILDKNYFLALSWMIDQLGTIKDQGLMLTGLCEVIIHITGCEEKEAFEKAYGILGEKQRKMEDILKDAEVVAKKYFKEKNLQHLVVKTKKIS